MKKFNNAKWETIQRRKAELHQIYRHTQAEWDHAHQSYSRAHSIFVSNYRRHYLSGAMLDVIDRDARTLAADAIEAKLKQMRRDWPAACKDFSCEEGFMGKHALIELYALMLDRRQLTDARDKAAQNQTAYSACFARLNEFAAQYGNGNLSRFNAVPDPGPAYSGTYEVY